MTGGAGAVARSRLCGEDEAPVWSAVPQAALRRGPGPPERKMSARRGAHAALMTSSPRSPLVALTRSPEDNAALAALLREDGMDVLEWPALMTRPLAPEGGPEALRATLDRSDVVAFTSRR